MQHSSLLQHEEDKDLFIDAVLSNMGVSTALFLCGIVRPLKEDFSLSATALGRHNNVTTGAALYHLQRLVLKGYVERISYRAWCLSDKTYDVLKKKDLNVPRSSTKYEVQKYPFKEGEFVYGG